MTAPQTPMAQQSDESSVFHWRMRVHFADTDAGGVMHHASYVRFLEVARTEWLAALGFGQRDLADRARVLFAISRLEIDYHQPARLDDHLDIHTAVASMRRASMEVTQSIWCDGRNLASARVWVVSVDADRFRPRPMPTALVNRLRATGGAGGSSAAARNAAGAQGQQ